MASPRARVPIQLRHTPGLDGLRALAVAAVVLYHAGVPWLRGGFLGVDVFFVLSGFLITSLLLAEWRRGRRPRLDLAAFWRRRARRILPALYLLLAAVLGAWLVFLPGRVAVIRGDALAAFGYVANWYFLLGAQPYFETAGRPSPFLHLWSLGVEEQFYLLWPVLFLAAARLRRGAAPALLAAAAVAAVWGALLYRGGADPTRVYYGADTHSSGLLIGSALAFVWRPARRLRRGRRGSPQLRERVRRVLTGRPFAEVAAAACLAGLVAAFVWLDEDRGFLYQGGLALVAALSGAALVAVSHPAGSATAAVLESRPVRWLGLRSYGVYLWHWPLLVLTGFPKSPLAALAVLAATLLLAEASYRLVEMPLRRLGARGLLERLRLGTPARRRASVALAAGLAALLVVPVARMPAPRPPAYLAQLAVDTVHPPAHPAGTALLRLERLNAEPPSPSPSPGGFSLPPIPVLAVGDSVMVGAAAALERAIPGIQIDAKEGRQVQTGIDLIHQVEATRHFDGAVVVDLGNNGTFTGDQLDSLMSLLGSARLVILVNLKEEEPWTAANNQVIEGAPREFHNAVLVNWVAASSVHPEYFWDDGLHLRPEGAQVYAGLIRAALATD